MTPKQQEAVDVAKTALDNAHTQIVAARDQLEQAFGPAHESTIAVEWSLDSTVAARGRVARVK